MKLYQPMMFFGLGGTGCRVGRQLERRFREELCGPDGTDLQGTLKNTTMAPFELPGSLQFIYADFDHDEYDRLRRGLVPTADTAAVIEKNSTFINELTPTLTGYPEVAGSLRLHVNPLVPWVPPPTGEPLVAPLIKGAGQFPTVGRAALFETLRAANGLSPVMGPLREALDRLSRSLGDGQALNGKIMPQQCDVFVAFSVVGGTGCGIFYDFLHLISHAFASYLKGWDVQIYPLVMMPSAFEEGRGGGRIGRLNAGRALLDLFRLVDHQNSGDIDNRAGFRVAYPGEDAVEIGFGTVQTGFLFSNQAGVDSEDLQRSIASLVLSLQGTARQDDTAESAQQSFASSWLNGGTFRPEAGKAGIGNSGVSTALVASLTVPVEEIADIIANRILARAVGELSVPLPAENNDQLITQFVAAAGLNPISERKPHEVPMLDPESRGATAITHALSDRGRAMREQLGALQQSLAHTVPELAKFRYVEALQTLSAEVDPFRLRRVVSGDPALGTDRSKRGFAGALATRVATEKAPDNMDPIQPPLPPPLRNRLFGLRKLKQNNSPIPNCIARQDLWYRWRTKSIWNEAWSKHSHAWRHSLDRLQRDLQVFTEAFANRAENEPAQFIASCQNLYRDRNGVVYFLPPGGASGDLQDFYELVLKRVRDAYVMHPAATEGEILNRIIGVGWWHALSTAQSVGVGESFREVRNKVKQEVKKGITGHSDVNPAMLPSLGAMLTAVAGGEREFPVALVQQFEQRLAGLLPGGFKPEGVGPLRVLVSYPAGARSAAIEAYLGSRLNLPAEPMSQIEYHPAAGDSLVVVMLRTNMGVNDVTELRGVLRHWSDALHSPQAGDKVHWRQRLGFDFNWVLTTPRDRARIVHRFLNALWDGLVEVVEGEPETPKRIRIRRSDAPHAVSIELELSPFGDTSSWGSLINAYELYTLQDDHLRLGACEQLMGYLPRGLEHGACNEPSELYRTFAKVAAEQPLLLEKRMRDLPAGARATAGQLVEFWHRDVHEAMRMPFELSARYYDSHIEMQNKHMVEAKAQQ